MPKTATIGAMRKDIQDILGRSGQVDNDRITLEIINAMEEYKWHQFWFTHGVFTFVTTANQDQYARNALGTSRTSLTGPPYETLAITRMEWVDGSVRGQVRAASMDDMRHILATGQTGYPEFYTWGYGTITALTSNPHLLLAPKPHDAFTMHCHYIRDLGIPTVDNQGSGWVFKDPSDETTVLSSTFTNDWFVHGWELIRARAIRNIYLTILHNPERAAIWAQIEGDAERSIASHGNSRREALRLRPWGLV